MNSVVYMKVVLIKYAYISKPKILHDFLKQKS